MIRKKRTPPRDWLARAPSSYRIAYSLTPFNSTAIQLSDSIDDAFYTPAILLYVRYTFDFDAIAVPRTCIDVPAMPRKGGNPLERTTVRNMGCSVDLSTYVHMITLPLFPLLLCTLSQIEFYMLFYHLGRVFLSEFH